MSGLKRLGTTHHCDLVKGSNSCLPKLPPQASRLKKWIREFHKSLMVSATNSNCKFFFRSRAAIVLERKRHIRSSHPYVIHPFSSFSAKREVVMCLFWMFTFFKDPFTTAYFSTMTIPQDVWRIVDLIADIIMASNIVLCFLTGIYKIQTKEVILEPSRIAKHYLLTYFFFDFFGTIPLNYVAAYFFKPKVEHEVYYTIVACLHFLRFVRIKSTIEYFRRITVGFGFEDTTHRVLRISLLSFYFLHWWACLIFIVPKIRFGLQGGTPSNASWIIMANIGPNTDAAISRRYIECLLSTFCHFHRAGYGKYLSEEPFEQIMFSFIYITGIFYSAYVIVVILEMVKSSHASETKYEELVNQLAEYMHKKKLPPHIRERLFLYYENRFQKHYFKEQIILNTLSDHLRYEIFLHSCKALVDRVAVFQRLSKSTVGAIVGCLKQEVFLPNDVILKAGTSADYLYFISYGTVSCVLSTGKEYCHYEDGDHFGEIGIFLEMQRITNIIVLEITEVFKLERKDLHHCIAQDDEISENFKKIAEERYAAIQNLLKQEVYDEVQQRRDVVHELRKGRILEHSHRRRKRY